jgi:cysteine desulfurase
MFRFRREVYLDNNATTKVCSLARKSINYVLKNCYGNPSSLYKIARNSAEILEESRKQVAEIINADLDEIFFTGCATEANNAVLKER